MTAIQSRLSKTILPMLLISFMLALPMVAFAQDDGSITAMLFGGTVWLVCCLAIFILDIAILIWVYQDANKRGANGVLWAAIVFFGSLVGLLLYFAIGRNQNRVG